MSPASMSRTELIEDLDHALAVLRRVIVRAIDTSPAKPAASSERARVVITQPSAAPAPKPAMPVQRVQKVVPLPDDVTHNGVTVSFRNKTVRHKGGIAEVSLRQAQVVAVLAKALPHLIPRGELSERAWPDLAISSRDQTMSTMIHPLSERLKAAHLRLHVTRKFGLSLHAEEG